MKVGRVVNSNYHDALEDLWSGLARNCGLGQGGSVAHILRCGHTNY